MRPRTKRLRGRAFECPCQHERLRDTADDDAPVGKRVGAWTYLWGECRGGVKFRRVRGRAVDVTQIDSEEMDRIRALPVVVERSGVHVTLERLASECPTEGQRQEFLGRSERIVTALKEGFGRWVEIGLLLADASDRYHYRAGFFGSWLLALGLEYHQASRLMTIGRRAKELPQLLNRLTIQNPHLEIAYLLARLPQGALMEVIEQGVPNGNNRIPLKQVRARQLRAYVHGLIGKKPQGRKPKPLPLEAPKPKERLGLPIEIYEAFVAAMDALRVLRKKVGDGWSDKERPAARRYWGQIWRRSYELQNDLGMGEL